MTSDDLFALPPGEFVAARDALVKELRAAGDREAAAEVKGLQRPNAVSAALNGLARGDAALLDAIWKAAASARGGAAVRDAIEAAVARVDGSAPTVDGVRRVLQDAAADAGVREQVVAGRLSREPSPDDTDPLAAWAASLGQDAPKAAGTKKRAAPAKKQRTAGPSKEDERRAALQTRLAEAQELRDETARAAEAATRIAGEKRVEMEEARAEAERARAAAADAQKAARDAQAQAEEAASALERAERTIRRLEGELAG